jgi:hypothetical protein
MSSRLDEARIQGEDMSTAPTGWYEDPEDSNFWRWWSGTEWGTRADRDDPLIPPPPPPGAFQSGSTAETGAGPSTASVPPKQKSGTPSSIDWSDRSTRGAAVFLAVIALLFLSRCGGEDSSDSGTEPVSSAEVAPAPEDDARDEGTPADERVRNETVNASVEVLSFSAASSEVLEVLFLVRNDESLVMETVSCSVNAYVSTQQVARFFSSGGTISDLQPGEQRRVTTSARIRGDQAASVTRAEVVCSSRLPEDRPAASGPSSSPPPVEDEDRPTLSSEDVQKSVMPFVFESSRTNIVGLLVGLIIIESVDLYDYDPETGKVLLDMTPAFDFDSGVRDDAWEVMRIFAGGVYGGPQGSDAWVTEEPPFAPSLRVTISTATYDCPGEIMRRLADARLSRAQWEEACRVR